MAGRKKDEFTRYFQNVLGVFQGGGCRGSAYVGAYREAIKRGVNFAEVAGTSAGSILAVLIGAGARPDFIEDQLNSIDYNKFLIPYKLETKQTASMKMARTAGAMLSFASNDMGQIAKAFSQGALYSSNYIEDFINSALEKLTGIREAKFSDLSLPTYVIATDLHEQNIQVWSKTSTPEASVAKAVRASCSIPFFFPNVDDRYIDGGIISNLPTFVFAKGREPATTRVLAFSLKSQPDVSSNTPYSGKNYIKSIVNTIIDGAGQVQDRLFSVAKIGIDTGDISATDFQKITKEENLKLAESGRSAASDFFDSENEKIKFSNGGGLLPGMDEVRSVITEKLADAVSSICVIEEDADFVFKMFPSLLYWRRAGVPITVVLPSGLGTNKSESYKRALLDFLGVHIELVEERPDFRGYFFDVNTGEYGSALVGPTDKLDKDQDAAVLYSGRSSQPAIKAMHATAAFPVEKTNLPKPIVEAADQREIINRLRCVREFVGCDVNIEPVNIADLYSITPYVHEFKFRQIPNIKEMYDSAGIDLFDAAQVRSEDGRISLITPPVIEMIGDKAVLLEGTTRATWLYKRGIKTMRAVVVKGGTFPPAAEKFYKIGMVRVVHNTVRGKDRYGEDFNYDLFRKIEEAVHLSKDMALS